MANWHGGKGSKRRPEDKNKFDENYEKIFGKKRPNSIKDKQQLYWDSDFEEQCQETYGDNMPDLKDSNEFRKISEETGEGDLSS